jgi:hypothetical protein
MWSRKGEDFTAKFPDVQAALTRPSRKRLRARRGIWSWTGERLDAPQQRMVNTAATVRRRLAPARPASFVASPTIRR